MNFYNKQYIRVDENKNITYGFSDAFEQPQENDICINEQAERHFELLGNTNPSLMNFEGVYLYKYENGNIIKKSEEDIALEYKPKIQKETVSDLEITFAEYVIENEERLSRLEEKINA